jgi:hypothetical protein
MHRGTILTKTGKGLKEATGKTSNLSRDLRNVLKEIDGQVSVSKLLDKFEKVTEPKLLEVLKQLEVEGYVREFVAQKDDEPRPSIGRPSISQPPASVGQDLDFTSLGSAGVPSKSSYLGPPSKPSEDAKLQAQAQEIARQVQARRAYEDGAARARAEAEVLQRKVAEARARKAIEEKARREVAERTKVGAASSADALDRARHEADERARREAEEKARLEAEVRARIEVELGVKRGSDEHAGRESAEKAQREAAERARKETEERARREREEQARAEHAARVAAEARARAETEMRVRRELEERARREADERSRQEEMVRRRAEEDAAKRRQIEEDRSLERSVREHEEKARRDAEREREEAERRKQEERARVEAEEGARREEEEKRAKEQEKRAKEQEKRAKEQDRQARDEERAQAKAETEQPQQAERSRERAGEGAWRGDEEAVRTPEAESIPARAVWAKRKPRSVARQLPVLLLVVLIVATAAVPFVSMEPGPYEKAAQTWLGQPVKIGSVSWSLFPAPQLKFEKVAIGKDPQMRVAAISATPEILSLFAERKVLRSLDLENASFPREFLPVLLMERGKGRPLGVERITAKGLKLDVPELKLAPLDLDASFAADGALKTVTFLNAERKLSVKLQPQRGRTAIEISSGSFPLPIGPDLVLSDFVAKGTVTRNELVLSDAEVHAFGGRLLGSSVRLRWSDGWSLDGALTARQLDVAKFAAPMLAGGTLEGKGVFSMRASAPERLLANARLEGNFTVHKGSIANIDMTRLLQGGSSSGGTTLFTEMSGGVSADSNRVSVRQIRLAAGLMNGTGQVEMDSKSKLSGRLQIELRSVQARATLAVSGTLKDPQYRRN